MNEMYCAEQIAVPSELGTVLKLLTKASIRDKPTDPYKWAANYFASQCNRSSAFGEDGKLTDAGRETMVHSQPYNNAVQQRKSRTSPEKQQQQGGGDQQQGESPQNPEEAEQMIVDALFDKYDPERSNFVSITTLPSLIMDLKGELDLQFTHDQMEEFVNSMQTDDRGMIDLDEFRVSFFQG